MTNDELLDTLLIEDNPGDVRLIEEMFRESESIFQQFDFGDRIGDGTRLHHEDTLEAGIERSSEVDVDVILLDLGLPDSTGLETLTAVIDATEFVPVVVLTGLSDEAIGVQAIQEGAQDYLVKDEVTSDLLVRTIRYALERNRQERERAHRREQLEALNRLNRIGQDITHAVITMSTREELEQSVCERLVNSDAYRFAWIGEVNPVNDRIIPRVTAGIEAGYLDEITITVDESDTAQGPAGKAVHSREVHVMQNVQTDPEYEPWRDEAIERGYRSSVSVPIDYEDVLYGVLNIYAASTNAFSEPEVEILSRLGDVIGHAITAIERKEALQSDTVLELEFTVDSFLEELVGLTAEADCHVDIEHLVRTDETVLGYGRVRGIPQVDFQETLADSVLVDELRILTTGEETYEFEIVTPVISPLVNVVATHGGRITSTTITDGSFRFDVEFPPGRDKRQLVELVEKHCPSAENRAQRLVDRTTDSATNVHGILHDSLTEKQQTALRTAYFAGLFEWPRKSTGEELAERLDISPSTFNQHLRTAQQNFFDEIFIGRTAESPDSE